MKKKRVPTVRTKQTCVSKLRLISSVIDLAGKLFVVIKAGIELFRLTRN